MWSLALVIVVIAILLIAMAFVPPRLFQKPKKNEEQDIMSQVEDAAFAVIEASLQAEPEKWEPVGYDELTVWLVNKRAKTAVYLTTGHSGLYVLTNCTFDEKGFPKHGMFASANTIEYRPPARAKLRIYKAAMEIVRPKTEINKVKKLAQLVEVFADKPKRMQQ